MSYQELITSCKYLLHNFPECENYLDYLSKRLSPESIQNFDFGYFPSGHQMSYFSSLINLDFLKEKKLLFSKNVDDYKGHSMVYFSFFDQHPLILPYRDTYGNIVALVGRTILSESERAGLKISKYKNTEFKKRNYLFGLYEAKKSILEKGFAYIVEGQFDVIKAFEKGVTNIVAVGNSNMSPYQFSLIYRYTNNLYLLLDNDEAGEKGREKIISSYSKYANIKNVYLPIGYKDIDEYLSENKPETLNDLI